jgi:hypothetical protein
MSDTKDRGMTEHIYSSDNETEEPGEEAALALIRAIVIGDDPAKTAAYHRLQAVWSQRKIDDLLIDVEALFRMAAG